MRQNLQRARDRAGSREPCIRVAPLRPVPTLAEDFRKGMLSAPRSLPPKYFYDERGSRLFDRICGTPEYYPTRVEDTLLTAHGEDIVGQARPLHVLELGAGSARKTRRLFDACARLNHRCSYLPFDVCEPVLAELQLNLPREYPWLEVTPLAGDYHAGLGALPLPEGSTLFLFLGSTLGNFTPEECRAFLAELRACMRADDWFLLGADRVKDPAVLHAAYNDAAGITAEFNLNVLRVLNRRLGCTFDAADFLHEARYDIDRARIEMYLAARRSHEVRVPALQTRIHLRRGERILTELSHKFTPAGLQQLLGDSGFAVCRHYEPEDGFFSLFLCRPDDCGVRSVRAGSST